MFKIYTKKYEVLKKRTNFLKVLKVSNNKKKSLGLRTNNSQGTCFQYTSQFTFLDNKSIIESHQFRNNDVHLSKEVDPNNPAPSD